MKCRLDSTNLKNWSRLLSTLTGIGDDEVHFAFTDQSLTLTVFNASLSVSGVCTLFYSFFETYSIPRGYIRTFSVPSKCIMKPFRSMRFITKTCSSCEISFEDNKNMLLITMGCKSLAEIRYAIKLSEEGNEMHADCDPENLANWIRTEAKFMIKNLNHFTHGKGLIDLTLKAEGSRTIFKNCANDLLRKEGKIYTEVAVTTTSFDRFNIREDTEITFQYRDFKTFIQFAEHMRLPLTIHFQGSADPVIACLKNDDIEATLMLATKYSDEADQVTATPSDKSSTLSNGISNVSTVPPPARKRRERKAVESTTVPLNNNRSRVPPLVHSQDVEDIVDLPPVISNFAQSSEPEIIEDTDKRRKKNPRSKSNRQREQENSDNLVDCIPETDERNQENNNRGNQPPRKKMRDFLEKVTEPASIFDRFPGHDVILVDASDDED